jgi:hypothetical protein
MATMPNAPHHGSTPRRWEWLHDTLRLVSTVSRLVPWGLLAIIGATTWQWLMPMAKRLLPWLF